MIELNSILIVIQILSIFGGGVIFLYRVDRRFNDVIITLDKEVQKLTVLYIETSKRLDKMDIRLEVLTETTAKIAAQEARMDAQDIRIQELSNRLNNTIRRPRG